MDEDYRVIGVTDANNLLEITAEPRPVPNYYVVVRREEKQNAHI